MRSIVEREWGLQRDLRFAMRAVAPVALLTGMLAGCAAPTHYMGIDISNPAPAFALSPGQIAFFQEQNLLLARAQAAGCIAEPEDKSAAELDADQQIACRAIAVQRATLEMRFEEGKGVERDLDKARKLYAKAASDSGGTIWVYSPPVGNGAKGRTIPVNAGLKRSGLVEAQRRLEGLGG